MKKTLLSTIALGAAIFANAQLIKSSYPAYAVDNFKSVTEVASTTEPGLAINFYKDTTNLAAPYDSATIAKTGLLSQTKTRLGDGKLTYNITQPYNVFLPVGIKFGTGKSLNIGAGVTKVKLKLTSQSDSSLYIRVALKDANNGLANSVGPNAPTKGDWYKDEIGFVVSKGNAVRYNYNASAAVKSAVSFTKVLDTIEVTVDFSGAYNSDYGTGVADYNFDSTGVSEVQITVLNDNQNTADSYNRYGLKNVNISLVEVRVGDFTLDVNDEVLFNQKGFVAYPNPTKGGIVHFSAKAENVKVVDMLGNVVFTAATASEVNTQNFNKGIYLVQSSRGATRFVVE